MSQFRKIKILPQNMNQGAIHPNSPFPTNIKGISLDFGNTLYDYYTVVFTMINQCWSKFHTKPAINYDQFLNGYEVAFNQIGNRLDIKGLATLNQSSSDYWIEFYALFYETLGEMPDVCLELAKDITNTWTSHPSPQLFPDVVPFLTLCKERNIKLALLSNTMNDFPRNQIFKDDLDSYFEVIFMLKHQI